MTGRERLARLVEVLEKVDSGELREIEGDPATFDIREWRCGSTACAIGWACYDEVLKREGLHMDVDTPMYKDDISWDAVMKFFDIGYNKAVELFCESTSDTARDVINKIKAYLAE